MNLRALSYEGARIRDVKNHLGARALDINGDAVGGATSSKVNGWGICCVKTGQWLRGTWPRFILGNKRKRGIQYGRKLSLLEGFVTVQSGDDGPGLEVALRVK